MENIRRLFLDDYRDPVDCVPYMYQRIGKENSVYLEAWTIVRNYDSFVNNIKLAGVPDIISFDHDLAEGYYHKNIQQGQINYDSNDFDNNDNKTGLHCAKWLVDYCIENNYKLPKYYIHSMNPVGSENIKNYLDFYNKMLNQ